MTVLSYVINIKHPHKFFVWYKSFMKPEVGHEVVIAIDIANRNFTE